MPNSKNSTRLSVILPVRNGENFLAQALSNLEGLLGLDDELIVIDDGSVDGSRQVVESFQSSSLHLRLLKGVGQGPAAARNAGLEIEKGKFVGFLDHDDLWPLARIERHIGILEQHPEIWAVVGKTSYEYEGLMSDRAVSFRNGTSALHHVHLGATTFRAEVFRKIGFFDPSLRFSEDHEFFLRLREANLSLYFDPAVSLRYRVHGANMSLDKSLQDLGVFKILGDSIRRRRYQGKIIQLPTFGNHD
ncbi:MAG: glycosyltransferase family 2 protein [Fluviibacter sp.]